MSWHDLVIEFPNTRPKNKHVVLKTLYDFSSKDGYLNFCCFKIRVKYRFFFLFMVLSLIVGFIALVGTFIGIPFSTNNHHHPCRSHPNLCKYAILIPIGVFLFAGCCYFITIFIWLLQETMMCTHMNKLIRFIMNTFSIFCCYFGCIIDDDSLKNNDPSCKCFWPIPCTSRYNFVISELVDNDVRLKDTSDLSTAGIHYFGLLSLIFLPFTLLLILIFGLPFGVYWIVIGLMKFIPWFFHLMKETRCCIFPLVKLCHCYDIVDDTENV